MAKGVFERKKPHVSVGTGASSTVVGSGTFGQSSNVRNGLGWLDQSSFAGAARTDW